MKNLFKKSLLVLIGVLITSLTTQVWAYTATFRCVPGLSFDNWSEGNKCKVTFRNKNDDNNDSWWTLDLSPNGLVYEKDGVLYKIYEVTTTTLSVDGAKKLKFMRYEGDTYKESSHQYDGWLNADSWSLRCYRGDWDWSKCEYGTNYKRWDIAAGTTIVWDAGQQSWTSESQLRLYSRAFDNYDDLTQLGETQQFYKTYDAIYEGYGALQFRGEKGWSKGQSTILNTDVSTSSGYILFTHYGNSYTDGQANWQKVSPAYKGSNGVTVYFDNTITGWSNVYLKYGSQWFNRYVEITSNVVPGTDGKLFYYTFPHDVYYGEYMFADGYGYTNYNPIDDSHCSHYTALQASNISSATTLIPTANAQKGATTVLDGYERTVTIASYSHGNVTVTYTDVNGDDQTETSAGDFSVQQACVITVSAAEDTGYDLTSLTINGTTHVSGNTYVVRGDIEIAATFSAETYTAANNIDKNGGDSHGQFTATYDANRITINTTPGRTGYHVDGYYGESGNTNRVADADGALRGNVTISSVQYTNSDKQWKKNGNVTLYTKWAEDTHTVTLANDGHGHIEKGSSTITNVSGVGIATTSGDITAVNNSGYHFDSWTGDFGSGVTIASGSTSTATIAINATADSKTIQANFEANTYSVRFNANGGIGSMGNQAFTYDVAQNLTANAFHKIGYAFAGWAEAADGAVEYDDKEEVSNLTSTNNGIFDLFAVWEEDVHTFNGSVEGHETEWNNAGNWSDGVVPTNDYSTVNLNFNVRITDGQSYHVGEIVLKNGYSLYIDEGGALEVAGTITKTSGDWTTFDIQLSATEEKQAALIFDNSAGDVKATVDMITTATWDRETSNYTFQYVAVPMTVVDVSSTFSSEDGIYTYVWNEGTGWERRGYYYSIWGFEAVAVTSPNSSLLIWNQGTLVSTKDLEFDLKYTSGDGVGMNMFGNSWTAPVKIAACEITGSADKTIYVYNSGTKTWVGRATSSAGESDVIPAMQAYCVLATSGGGTLSINYDNAVRGVGSSYRTTPLRAPKRSASEANDHITLFVSDGERETDLRLYENEQFTDEFDNGWEVRHIEGDGLSGELVAQTFDKMTTLAVPNLEGQVLGFIPGVASNYIISFSGDGDGYYLNDVETQQSTLIAEGNTYMFTPSEDDNMRFIISKTPIHQTPTSVDVINDGTKARKQMINGILYIIRDGRLYDATGALVK